ncbi:MAG: type IIA DNA topoisomerase subunit B [Erysipelotrichaceae bacterium]|nr:type IIA DNA topoisomerase subunit B [Erysipelotrichaceae bacterium]
MANSNYTADDIHVLQGLEGVRKRPAMYIGSTNATGLHHLVWEVVDNAVDEALSGYGNVITVTIHKDGSVSVLDEGRGIPVGINKETGKSAVDLVFSELHAGGKFNSAVYKSAAGLHGVGASVTNALSEYCDVTVFRDGNINHIRYENGGHLVTPLEVTGQTRKHGTLVRFKPDATIFTTVEFKADIISSHLQESAFLMKGVHFVLIDERVNTRDEFYYQNGLVEYINNINMNKNHLTPVMSFSDVDSETNIDVEIAMQFCNEDYNETTYSYVNNVRTRDGGTHETGFRAGLTKAVNDFGEQQNILKGKKLEGNDIREGLTTIIALKIPEAYLEFEGQTKGKLGTPQAVTVVSNIIYNKFSYYLLENKELAMRIIKKCLDSQAARIAARKAKEEVRSSKKVKQEVILSDKLTPAQSKDYKKNELFIVEGDSAGGSAKKGRDRLHQAILPLRGKPLNTDSISMDRLLHNEEFATVINTIGAGFGQSFDIEDIHYGKIIIMTDADTDGAHIQTLLLTFFYHYMRELITSGHVYIAVPPLYRVYKEDKSHKVIQRYAWSDAELDEAKKYVGAGYKINRYKGLGEMDAVQLKETTMDPKSRLLIQVDIEDPFLVERRVNVLMGKDTSLRKKWVEDNVDFNEVDTFIKEVK